MFNKEGKYTNNSAADESSEAPYGVRQHQEKVWHVLYKPNENEVVATIHNTTQPKNPNNVRSGLPTYEVMESAIGRIPRKFLTLHSAAVIASMAHRHTLKVEVEGEKTNPTSLEIYKPPVGGYKGSTIEMDSSTHPLEIIDKRLQQLRNKIWQAHIHPSLENEESQNKLLDLARAHAYVMNVFDHHFKHNKKDNENG